MTTTKGECPGDSGPVPQDQGGTREKSTFLYEAVGVATQTGIRCEPDRISQ